MLLEKNMTLTENPNKTHQPKAFKTLKYIVSYGIQIKHLR